jgi:hypothetical protein
MATEETLQNLKLKSQELNEEIERVTKELHKQKEDSKRLREQLQDANVTKIGVKFQCKACDRTYIVFNDQCCPECVREMTVRHGAKRIGCDPSEYDPNIDYREYH